jgi:dihydrofolate reductase
VIKAIFATDLNGGMGFQGTLPWPPCRDDFKWFKEHTLGQIVIMGRRTWDDPKMPKPLPDRISYVVTNRPIYEADVMSISGNDYTHKIIQMFNQYKDKKIFVIGGPKIITDCIGMVDEIYLTTFNKQYIVDTTINLYECLKGFRQTYLKHNKSCTHSIYKHASIPN